MLDSMKHHAHRIAVIACAACCAFSVAAQAESFSGQVVGISDGDTIKVMRAGKAVKVRLRGIDCPERRQAFGRRAKQYASDLVFGKVVTVRVTGKDRWGRLIGEVLLPDGTSLNRALVNAGLAWWYKRYAPKDRDLEQLERGARAARRGLWADPEPEPPWKFRKKKRKRRR